MRRPPAAERRRACKSLTQPLPRLARSLPCLPYLPPTTSRRRFFKGSKFNFLTETERGREAVGILYVRAKKME